MNRTLGAKFIGSYHTLLIDSLTHSKTSKLFGNQFYAYFLAVTGHKIFCNKWLGLKYFP